MRRYEEDLIKIVKKYGAMQYGHFRYTSGMHGPFYFAKEVLLARTAVLSYLARLMAEGFSNVEIDTIAGIAYGGAVLAGRVAEQLEGGPNEKYVVPVEKIGDGFGIKPA